MTKPVHTTGNKKSSRKSADNSRARIISAARKVFAEQPYHIATMRMVGKAGGFDHQLISYYFPSKADLFEVIVAEACEEFYNSTLSWFRGIGKLSVEDGLALFIDRLLEYHFANPEVLRIMAMNAALIERLDEIPGYQHIVKVFANIRVAFERNAGLKGGSEDIGRYVYTFNTMIVTYLGSAPSQAEIMGMDPKSEQYRTWVKETLLYVFLPLLKKLISPE